MKDETLDKLRCNIAKLNLESHEQFVHLIAGMVLAGASRDQVISIISECVGAPK